MNRVTVLLSLVFFFCIACKDKDEIIPQQPVEKSATATASDSSQVASPTTSSLKTNLIFKDSAFFQLANFESLPYRIMTPRNYDSTSTYPLIIFLHGIDERGTDNEKQLKWGASLFQSDSISKQYPSFVVFPQCPLENKWFDLPIQDLLRRMINNLVAANNIDPNRIYIVGLSMGAYGTYTTVAANPGLFAAAVAISGHGDEKKSSAMAKTNWRIYAGKKDRIVPSEKSEKMAKALKESGASVSLTLYPNADHLHSWTNAFAEKDFCSWLFSNKK